MKGLMLIIFVAAVILLGVQFFKTGPDNKSNVERTVDSYGKTKATLNVTSFVSVKRALVQYKMQKGNYPDDLNALIPNFLNNPSQLKDSWGSLLEIVRSNGHINLVSRGPDGKLNTADDQKFPL